MKIKRFAEWALDDFFEREEELQDQIYIAKLKESAIRYMLITAVPVGAAVWDDTAEHLLEIKHDREDAEDRLKFIEEQRHEYFGHLVEEPPAAVGT